MNQISRSDEKRKAILEAAKTMFASCGVRKSTIQSIAEKAGVNVSDVKKLFGNKQLLALAVQAKEIEKLQREYFANLPDASVVESVAFIIKTRLAFIEKNEERTKLCLSNALLGRQPWSDALDKMIFQLSVEFASLFEKGIRQGEIRKDADVNIAVRSLTSFYLTGIVSMGMRAKSFKADVVWEFIKPQVELLVSELSA